jgi:hypothetical protein
LNCWQIVLEYLKVVFDLLKGIAWPFAIVAIAFYFRDDLRKLLPRITKASASGFEFNLLPQQPDTNADIESKLISQTTNETIDSLASKLEVDIASYPSEKRLPVLIRDLAYWRSVAFFENTFSLIWGSQIAALESLEQQNRIGRADAISRFENEVKPIFDAHKLPIDFDKWSSFLLKRNLAMPVGDAFVITGRGKDFLSYVRSQSFALKKGL